MWILTLSNQLRSEVIRLEDAVSNAGWIAGYLMGNLHAIWSCTIFYADIMVKVEQKPYFPITRWPLAWYAEAGFKERSHMVLRNILCVPRRISATWKAWSHVTTKELVERLHHNLEVQSLKNKHLEYWSQTPLVKEKKKVKMLCKT